LDALGKWSAMWGMQFNVPKCKVMHMGHNNPKYQYKMAGQTLSVASEEKDIGVTATNALKPSAQCARAAKTAQTVLGQISRAFHYRDRHVFMRLYKQYVRPHLEFAVQAWSPWTETDRECLERVQKRAVGMVSGLQNHEYEERLVELGMTTLAERRHRADMHMVHKILKNENSLDHTIWFEKAVESGRATRITADPLNIKPKAGRLEVRRNFFTVRVIDDWNRIPSNIKRITTASGFKDAYVKLRERMTHLTATPGRRAR
jgi:ribonuclease P/MRP protein subunit RPP40